MEELCSARSLTLLPQTTRSLGAEGGMSFNLLLPLPCFFFLPASPETFQSQPHLPHIYRPPPPTIYIPYTSKESKLVTTH